MWATIVLIDDKLDCKVETLGLWIPQDERYLVQRPALTAEESEKLKCLQRKNVELKMANEILRKASAFFRPSGEGSRTEVMAAFIDRHLDACGVEPICHQLPSAPSTYCEHKIHQACGGPVSERARRVAELKRRVERIWEANFRVYFTECVGSLSSEA